MPLADVEKALLKYEKDEEKIDKKLQEIKSDKNLNVKKSEFTSINTLDRAVKRNKEFINELEVIKGNLRSKAIYSPTEMQWKRICENYKVEPSLPVTTWKCISPIFV
ncbi:uncharacterized protein LOC130447302 [Diorhabda sublineata]|uniref:uncharacterized protein LOC130447302 n=1 Tax=Diorhabda sublineata TaxID=1163346 RepID=UPI0024E1048E|nr:uncharacterized protein LOC130447302 [Diorhabda sublineata]